MFLIFHVSLILSHSLKIHNFNLSDYFCQTRVIIRAKKGFWPFFLKKKKKLNWSMPLIPSLFDWLVTPNISLSLFLFFLCFFLLISLSFSFIFFFFFLFLSRSPLGPLQAFVQPSTKLA